MEAIAKTRHLKGSPRKARLVIDLIRGRNVSQALNILKFTDKRAADPIEKTLRSAIANATYQAERQNIAIDPDDLFVKTCFVDMGAHKNRRRMRPAPQGRAFREQRHYCHITILVSSDAPVDTKSAKKSLQTSGEKGDGGAKGKDAPKPEAIKKTAKPNELKDTKKTGVEETPKAAKETKKAKAEKPAIEETVEAKTPSIETPQAETPVVTETPSVETSEASAPTEVETPKVEAVEAKSETVEIPEAPAETEAAKNDESKVEKTTEAETSKEPKAAKSEKTAPADASDILEMDSPKAAKAKEEKQKAEASDVKNVQSQTPAERNETKQADERQLDENDILELQ
jgi:large subunit ribosomal protein L22